MNERYQEKAQRFAELYQLKYLFDDGCLRIVNLYDLHPSQRTLPGRGSNIIPSSKSF